MRPFLALALLCSLLVPRFAGAQDVLVQGDPPLTTDMVAKYQRFIRWTLDTPLTVAQEERLRNDLVTTWKANDREGMGRVLNLLSFRSGIEDMQLHDNEMARQAVQREALRNWNRAPTNEMARWGLPLYDASHKSLLPGNAPFTRQMVDAYNEMGAFIVTQVYGAPATKLDADERVQLSESLGRSFPSWNADQKAAFARLPAVWVQLRTAWPTLSDADKAALKADWKAHFEPKPTAAAPKKPVVAAPTGQVGLLGRLMRMTWLTDPAVVAKLQSVGGDQFAYKNGW